FNNDGSGSGTNQWKRFTLDFTPVVAGNTITLQGSSVDGQSYIGLDNVTLVDNVAATPEPGTFTLFLGAAAPVGALLRHRRKTRLRRSA
ncbi:MAG: hypothetical protein JWN14_2522, partial [Chthonomonadales bacterium]|nr:hypothetical protein [Chthonomonadales bacterium]